MSECHYVEAGGRKICPCGGRNSRLLLGGMMGNRAKWKSVMLICLTGMVASGCGQSSGGSAFAPVGDASSADEIAASADADAGIAEVVLADGTETSPDIIVKLKDVGADVEADGSVAADAPGEIDLPPACTPGACDDGNACTTDICDPASGCGHTASAATCEDGSLCTAGDACQGGVCAPGKAKPCADGNPCTSDGCDAATGACVFLPDAATCNDGNGCTTDSCDPASGCVHTNNSSACDDGNACTVSDGCKGGLCKGTATCCAADADCDDGKPCTLDACSAAKACVHAAKPDGAICDDGSACTQGDACAAGACKGKPTVTCDDGDACTKGDVCTGGVCKGKPAVTCTDGNVCTQDGCDPATGKCTFTNNSAKCDDGNDCTADACAGGSCKGVPLPDGTACTDGNGCTAFDSCTAGVCAGTAVDVTTVCDDGKPCTEDTCDPAKGCQHSGKLFNVSFGLTVGENGQALVVLPDGIAFAGYTHVTVGGDSDARLVRTDIAGKVLWAHTFGGSGYDDASAIATLPGGGFVFAGSTQSKGAGGMDAWLVRTDSTGKVTWDKTYGGSDVDRAAALIAVPNGFALAGLTGSKGAGSIDAWLILTDPAGNMIWDKTYGGADDDLATAVAGLPDGFALAGATSSNTGPFNAWLIRTDATGTMIWQKTYGGAGINSAQALAVLPDGFAIVGSTTGKTMSNNSDLWLIRTDSSGTVLWEKTYGGTDNDQGHALAVLPDGFALGGMTNSFTPSPVAWLIRTDLSGTALWDKKYYGMGSGGAQAVVAMPDSFAMVGQGLVRTDLWGNAACADSGVCFTTTPVTCDDGNACTLDLCDAAKGCTHTAAPDGAACGAGKTCSAGKCG